MLRRVICKIFGNFAAAFCKDAGSVTTAEIHALVQCAHAQAAELPEFRRVIHLLFEFAVARGYASDDPAAAGASIEVRGDDIEILTPTEMSRLLAVASLELLPCLALPWARSRDCAQH